MRKSVKQNKIKWAVIVALFLTGITLMIYHTMKAVDTRDQIGSWEKGRAVIVDHEYNKGERSHEYCAIFAYRTENVKRIETDKIDGESDCIKNEYKESSESITAKDNAEMKSLKRFGDSRDIRYNPDNDKEISKTGSEAYVSSVLYAILGLVLFVLGCLGIGKMLPHVEDPDKDLDLNKDVDPDKGDFSGDRPVDPDEKINPGKDTDPDKKIDSTP